MVIRYHKSSFILCGSFELRWFIDDEDSDDENPSDHSDEFRDFERITRMELWSIPRFKIV